MGLKGTSKLKVIFFGLGSIGQRHIKNLRTLCEQKYIDLEVHAYRTNKQNNAHVNGVATNFYSIDEIIGNYDAAFITNPTSCHYETLNYIKKRARYFFVEKPLFDRKHNIEAMKIQSHKVYVAAPLRFKNIMKRLREFIADKDIYSVRVICSSYLPHWRNMDYRNSYSAMKDLGGGVELDCIHELDYVTYLFGFPSRVNVLLGKKSNLSIDSNDIAVYTMEYADKIVEVHLDYFGIYPQRKIELITNEDLIVCDLLQDTITSEKYGLIEQVCEEKNVMYLNELNYFLNEVVAEKDNFNDLIHAYKVLMLAKGEILQ